ncbi:MAG: hypothetical protein HYX55_08925 [Chloroflexi bacterium]|nr:hypothetical protein [Chloroflexota bacterium]
MSWGQAGQMDLHGSLLRVWPRPPLPGSPAAGGPDRVGVLHRLLSGNFIPACTAMCRREALLKVGGFVQPQGMPAADYPTWLRLVQLGNVVPAEGVLGFWRRHPSQVTQVMEREMLAVPRFNWASWVAADLSPADRVQLGLTAQEAARIDTARRARTDFADGRLALRRNRRDDAARHFRDAMHGVRGVAKAKALVALISTRLGLNVDHLLQVRNRVRRSRRT